MKYIFQATLGQLTLMIKDSDYRSLLYKPFFKGIRAFILIFFVCIILSYVGCQIKDLFFSEETSWVLIFTNFFIILLLPPILAFIYFSLFCEKEYCSIASFCLEKYDNRSLFEEKILAKQESTFSTFLFQSIILITIIFFCLIASLFFPILGLFVAGLILFWDFSSYFFINNNIDYKDRINFIYKNLFSIFLVSVFLAFVCLIPFSILFFYPIGVGLITYLIVDLLMDKGL